MTMTHVPTQPTANTVTWWEIPVEDLDKAQTFYAAVFGWTYTPFGDEYAGISAGDQMIGALSKSELASISQCIRIYVQVDDMEATFAKVEANGGAVKTPRTEIGGDMGWWGDFTDPQGRVIGLATDTPASSAA
jgi:uncharacterized protein